MTTPSSDTPVFTRIQEFARMVVDEQMRRAKAEGPEANLMMTMLGMNDAYLVESMLRKPETQIAAIMMYLEELAAEREQK